MKNIASLISHFFKKPCALVTDETAPSETSQNFRDFSYHEAFYMHKPFRLRNGMPFKIISLDYKLANDSESYILTHIEGHELPTCYYTDGIANELELSGYDLVMVD